MVNKVINEGGEWITAVGCPNSTERMDSLKEIAKELKSDGMRCNCDLDSWEPEQSTGHSHVCRIHKAALEKNKLNNK